MNVGWELLKRHLEIQHTHPIPMPWRYDIPSGSGDGRKLVTLEEDEMIWVGIRFWNMLEQRWYNGSRIETCHVVAWIDLPSPATTCSEM